jgi:fumarate hydratase class II
MLKYRLAKDSLGQIKVPIDAYFDAQTARSLQNFPIGNQLVPSEIIKALAIIKKAAAQTNQQLHDLNSQKTKYISLVCDEILAEKLNDQFPLKIWQTGSGTHTNMNVNEVIANRATELMGGKIGDKKMIHPNDDVNMAQSSNDVFPAAIHIAAAILIHQKLLPNLTILAKTLQKKINQFKNIIKIGRTHLMDATPLSLGQEFSAYQDLVARSINRIKSALKSLYELPLGGTAIGTGINTKKQFSPLIIKKISQITKLPFREAPNKFAAISTHEALAAMSGSFELLASVLIKIAHDIRLLSSGPRSGLRELIIPANEPGSSIMSGKINPTQAEALIMVCLQVKGNHRVIVDGAFWGELQLNIAKPVIGYNLLEQIHLLSDAIKSFHDKCFLEIQPHLENITKNLNNSLMLVTVLNKKIGYDQAAKIAKTAEQKNISLKEAAAKLKILTAVEFDQLVQPKKMIQPGE